VRLGPSRRVSLTNRPPTFYAGAWRFGIF
jgi:hypothetical protein